MQEILNALLRSQGELHGKVDIILDRTRDQERRLRKVENNWIWLRRTALLVITIGGLVPKAVAYFRS
jgi:hypothetical protein